jgi:CHASE1-domain containing sensor protein
LVVRSGSGDRTGFLVVRPVYRNDKSSDTLESRRENLEGFVLEPIREVWIHDEAVAASRLSMMRIMARRTKAATVVA